RPGRATGVLLFDDDPAARVTWLATTRRIYLDERPRTETARRIFFAGVRAREEARGRRGTEEKLPEPFE
ncbi:MAG: hypothetical protein M3535_01810, partial [Actinomycetota bacterium]|nr:hypothetical protein [Actinomycetota bacterium]